MDFQTQPSTQDLFLYGTHPTAGGTGGSRFHELIKARYTRDEHGRTDPSSHTRTHFTRLDEAVRPRSGTDLFLSHVHEDKPIVTLLTDLLLRALPSLSCLCSSVNGLRLPGGDPVGESLLESISRAETFVVLITPKLTPWVVSEAAIRWSQKRKLIPLIACGGDGHFSKLPFSNLHALRCDDAGQIYQLVDDLAHSLNMKAAGPAAYQERVESLVRASKTTTKRSRSTVLVS